MIRLDLRGTARRHDGAGEQLSASSDAAHHRADGHSDDLGDLDVLEPIDVVQLDGGGEVLGDLGERLMHRLRVEPGHDLGEQRVTLAAQELVVGVLEPRDEDELLAPAALLAGVAQHRAKDPVDPGARVRVVAQVGKAEPRADARLLDRVLGVGHRIRAPDGEGEQPVEVGHDDRFESCPKIGGRFAGGRET